LTDLVEIFTSDRSAAVCRELTKTYEEVRRAPLGELAEWAATGPVRGEITLVVAGAPPASATRPDDARLAAEVASAESEGTTRKAAILAVATRYGLPKREVYNLVHRPR
jgi:16S rRNA (cytidine1402-2'-O)-methyltransferase